eukprot:g25095.t1
MSLAGAMVRQMIFDRAQQFCVKVEESQSLGPRATGCSPAPRSSAVVLAAADDEQLRAAEEGSARRLTFVTEIDDPDYDPSQVPTVEEPPRTEPPRREQRRGRPEKPDIIPATVDIPAEAKGSKLLFVLGGDMLRETSSVTKVIWALKDEEPVIVFHLATSTRHRLHLPSLGLVVRIKDRNPRRSAYGTTRDRRSALKWHRLRLLRRHFRSKSWRFELDNKAHERRDGHAEEDFGLRDAEDDGGLPPRIQPTVTEEIVDNLLECFEEAVDVTRRHLEPLMTGYEGEANIASSARARLQELKWRQANLQAQLVVMGPCQVGKTSLTYALVGFPALPPAVPSMVTVKWVGTLGRDGICADITCAHIDLFAYRVMEAVPKTDAKSPPVAPKAPVAEAPATPEKLVASSPEASPSRLAALKEEGAKVLSDAKAKARDVAAKVQSVEPVTVVLTKASEMRQSATTAAAATTGAAMDRWGQLKSAAGNSYASLKENGVKAWVSENAVAAKGLAARQLQWSLDTTKSMVDSVKAAATSRAQETLKSIQGTYAKGKTHAASALANAKDKASQVQSKAKDTASAAHSKAKEVVTDKHVQATAAGVLGGAATLGASGGATGLAAGTVVGAAVGVLPALFTFGLSIPLGAAIGGGAGLAVGASVGAAAGGVAGGAAGHQAYAKREQIGEFSTNTMNKVTTGVDAVKGKVTTGVDAVKGKAVASAQYLKDRASQARERLGRKA